MIHQSFVSGPISTTETIMAKLIQHWECEVCRRRYDEKEEAERCESHTPVEYPVGCVFMDDPNGMYGGFCFAVAENDIRGHLNSLSLWACRNNGGGDSLGNSMCGGAHTDLGKYSRFADPRTPTFQRMINWLQSQNIPVTVWDGERPVPLAEWKPVPEIMTESTTIA